MKVTQEFTIDAAPWNDLVTASPESSFYHEPVWLECLDSAYSYYQPFYIAAWDDAGRLVGGIPAIRSVRAGLAQILSLPYGTYGTPLVHSSDDAERRMIRDSLIRAWIRVAREPLVVRAHLTEFEPVPAGSDRAGDAEAAIPPEWRRVEETHVLDLAGGFEAVWNDRFEGDKRTECRKAERAGVTVAAEEGPAVAPVLDRLYRNQAEEWTNHTPFPPALVERLAERAPETVRIWVARHEEKPVAAQMIFHHKRTATIWLACNTPEARRLGAGNLLYRAVIEDACRRGHLAVNLGGDQGSADLRKFKTGFGTSAVSYASFLFEPRWFRPLHRLQYRLRGIET